MLCASTGTFAISDTRNAAKTADLKFIGPDSIIIMIVPKVFHHSI